MKLDVRPTRFNPLSGPDSEVVAMWPIKLVDEHIDYLKGCLEQDDLSSPPRNDHQHLLGPLVEYLDLRAEYSEPRSESGVHRSDNFYREELRGLTRMKYFGRITQLRKVGDDQSADELQSEYEQLEANHLRATILRLNKESEARRVEGEKLVNQGKVAQRLSTLAVAGTLGILSLIPAGLVAGVMGWL